LHLHKCTTLFVHTPCRWMDFHRRQQIWLPQVDNLGNNNAVTTMLVYQIIVQELPLAMTVNLRNTLINIMHRFIIVTLLHCSHIQVLRCFISILHSPYHKTVQNQTPAQTKDILVMGYSGNDITSTKVVMVSLKCSHLSIFQGNGHHLQVYWECLEDRQETIQSKDKHHGAQLCHPDLLLVNLGVPPSASQYKDSRY